MLKTALLFGGTYAIGSMGGAKIADAAKVTNDGARTGIKIGTGVAAYFVLAMFLR